MPPSDWRPPERLLEASGGTAVRVIEESGARSRVFDFANIRDPKGKRVLIDEGLQRWFASAFAERTSPRSGVKRVRGAESLYSVLSWLARYFSVQSPTVREPGDVTEAHVLELWTHTEGRNAASQCTHLHRLRQLWRDDKKLSKEVRDALYKERMPEVTEISDVPEYDDDAMQRIMVALRHDIRVARDRIRAGQHLLARYRAGQIRSGHPDHELGMLLDVFERTGDLPRTPGGTMVSVVWKLGGSQEITRRLCLSSRELTAFGLLLTALTAENFGTVAAWPAAHYRPDGGVEGVPQIALIEASKPRRGPEREHMVTPVEDVPEELAVLLVADDPEPRLFRSPLRVYQLLLDLTQLARRHGGHSSAFAGFRTQTSGAKRWTRGADAKNIARWSVQHGFPTKEPTKDGVEPVEARRLRQTGIERKRRPVAHSRSTMNDHYLARSQDVATQSRVVVADALRSQVAAARKRRSIAVLPAALVARAASDLEGAARDAELDPTVLRRLVSGEQDTVLAGCTDHLNSPGAPPGEPCAESFLACLGCENARALPHQLPLQIAALDQMSILKVHTDVATWNARHAVHHERLQDLVGQYHQSEQDLARRRLTGRQSEMINDLMAGRMDLR
uniref:Uncharacterized protein n=2 Tax=Streptomyces TaxID=1883 RepID=A0A8D3WN30_STRFA